MADLLHSQCDEMLVYHIATPVNKWIPPCDVVNKVMMGAIRAPLVFWLPFVPQWFHKNNIHVLIFVDSFPDRRMPKNVAFSVCSHFYVILLSWPHSVRCVGFLLKVVLFLLWCVLKELRPKSGLTRYQLQYAVTETSSMPGYSTRKLQWWRNVKL